MAYVSIHSLPIIYLNMPKAACTSIKNILYFLEENEWKSDPLLIHYQRRGLLKDKYEDDKKIIDKKIGESFVFTFVRHPGKRIYSLYQEKIHSTTKNSFPRLRALLEREFGANFNKTDYNLERERRNFLSFLKFIEANQKNQTSFRKDPHWLPQSRIVRRATKKRKLDFIGRIENFKSDFNLILNKFNLNEDSILSKKFNANTEKDYSYDEVMTDQIFQLVHAIYINDFIDFGYSVNAPNIHINF